MRNERLQPWGCDQQGRYPTRACPRLDHWGEYEWRETMPAAQSKPVAEPIKPTPPLTWGGALMAVAIVAAIVSFVVMGPWL